jgi:hypothetical protein
MASHPWSRRALMALQRHTFYKAQAAAEREVPSHMTVSGVEDSEGEFNTEKDFHFLLDR